MIVSDFITLNFRLFTSRLNLIVKVIIAVPFSISSQRLTGIAIPIYWSHKPATANYELKASVKLTTVGKTRFILVGEVD